MFLISVCFGCFGYIFMFMTTVKTLNLYTRSVSNSSVIKRVQVTSISECYSNCWRNTPKCCAVAFLISEINKQNTQSSTCHMLQCENDNNGELIEMDVFFVPEKVQKTVSVQLAKNGIAEQSTNYQVPSVASLAVDGDYIQTFIVNSTYHCTHTFNNILEWWSFTFNYDVRIEKVVIYNRVDCCGLRINNALVEVYDENKTNYLKCGNVDKSDDPTRIVTCSGNWLKGRGVRISTINIALHICEVDFYGIKL